MSDTAKYLTPDDLAKRFNVSASWVKSEARAKRFPHQRLGRNIRFTQTQVEQIEQLLEVEAATVAPNVSGLTRRSKHRRYAERRARAG